MNKKEYIEALRAALNGADNAEIIRTEEFYSEMIDDALEEGASEEEAVAGLEPPSAVAARIMGEFEGERKKHGGVVWFIIAVVMASPIWLPVAVSVAAAVLSVYISLWAVIVSLAASALGTAAGALAGVVISIAIYHGNGAADSLFILGAAVAAAGIAIYLTYITVFTAKQYIKLSRICIFQVSKWAGRGKRSK